MRINFKFKLTMLLISTVAGLNGYAQQTHQQGLNDVIKSENNFAKAATNLNVKKAFLQNLDSAGLIFNGAKTYNGLAVYGKSTENNNELLSWYPVVAEVAASGELGFTSGPWSYRAKRTDTVLACGYYFTVWKRNKNGEFKVMLDGGVSHPLNHDTFKPETKLQTATDLKYQNHIAVNASGIDLKPIENAFTALAETDPVKAYQVYLGNTAWMLRNNMPATPNKPAGLAMLGKE